MSYGDQREKDDAREIQIGSTDLAAYYGGHAEDVRFLLDQAELARLELRELKTAIRLLVKDG